MWRRRHHGWRRPWRRRPWFRRGPTAGEVIGGAIVGGIASAIRNTFGYNDPPPEEPAPTQAPVVVNINTTNQAQNPAAAANTSPESSNSAPK